MSREDGVERVERYEGKVRGARVVELLGLDVELPLVRRTDYHDDGSEGVTYYLELDREQYERLAVLFADVWREPRPSVHVRPADGGWVVEREG